MLLTLLITACNLRDQPWQCFTHCSCGRSHLIGIIREVYAMIVEENLGEWISGIRTIHIDIERIQLMSRVRVEWRVVCMLGMWRGWFVKFHLFRTFVVEPCSPFACLAMHVELDFPRRHMIFLSSISNWASRPLFLHDCVLCVVFHCRLVLIAMEFVIWVNSYVLYSCDVVWVDFHSSFFRLTGALLVEWISLLMLIRLNAFWTVRFRWRRY